MVSSRTVGEVCLWDLDEHQRLGEATHARHATVLPGSWTDPETADVYDLTRELVDADGGRWELVDYDGFEPIVAEIPVDPRVTRDVADAHADYDFGDVVTPGPPRPPQPRVVNSSVRQFYEFRVLDPARRLSTEQVTTLRQRYPKAEIDSTSMVWDFNPEEWVRVSRYLMYDKELSALLVEHFDICLEFQAGGSRHLVLRLPVATLTPEMVAPYANTHWNSPTAKVHGDDLLLTFSRHEEGGELTYWGERPDEWLDELLPLWDDLARGDLSAAFVAALKANSTPPPVREATMSPQLTALAVLLDLDPEEVETALAR